MAPGSGGCLPLIYNFKNRNKGRRAAKEPQSSAVVAQPQPRALPKLDALPHELLVKIGFLLIPPAKPRPESDYFSGGDRAWKIFRTGSGGPCDDLVHLCRVSRHINGPATEALYFSVHLERSAVGGFFRTLFEHSDRANLVRHLQFGCLCPGHAATRFPSFHSTAKEDKELLEKALKHLNLDLAASVADKYGNDWSDPYVQSMVIVLLLKDLKSIDVGFNLIAPTNQWVNNAIRPANHVRPPAVWTLLTEQRIEIATPRGNSSIFVPAAFDKLISLSLSRLAKQHGSETGRSAETLDIHKIVLALSLPALKRLDLLGFGTPSSLLYQGGGSAVVRPTHSFLRFAPKRESQIEHLTLVHCKLSREDLHDLIARVPQLKTFVWKSPDIEDMCRSVGIFRMAFTNDVISALTPCRKTLETLTFAGIETCEHWDLAWDEYRRSRTPFLPANLRSITDLHNAVVRPIGPALTTFPALRELDICMPSLLGLLRPIPRPANNSFVHNPAPSLRYVLPPSLTSLRLIVPASMFGFDTREEHTGIVLYLASCAFKDCVGDLVREGEHRALPALRSLVMEMAPGGEWPGLDRVLRRQTWAHYPGREGLRVRFLGYGRGGEEIVVYDW